MTPTNQWTLLEPDARCSDLRDGTQARLHDPLWLLARQWQFGEFWGTDAGSPATARLDVESARLTRYRPGPLPSTGGAASGAIDLPSALPLETLVEREPVSTETANGPNARLSAEAGLHFLRLLEVHGAGDYRDAYLSAYPLARHPDASGEFDPQSRRFLDVVARRVPDGALLHQALRSAGGTLPSVPPIAAVDREKVLRASRAWIDWYERQLFRQPGGPAAMAAWTPDRMEYEFAVSGRTSAGAMVLATPEYAEGRLDWSSFVSNASASLGGTTASPTPSPPRAFLPAPVRFRGMPASRLWEFEDGRVNLGQIQAGSNDLAQLLLVEFALVFGNDWFLVPLELEAGSLSRVASLVVTNTFNERLLVPHASTVDGPDASWRMFAISPDPSVERADPYRDVFLLPPALGTSIEGEPIEEVLFLRDELANLAWAVERVVEGEGGGRLNRLETYQMQRRALEQEQDARTPLPGAKASAAGVCYRLGSSVPEYWIPLLPVQVAESGGRPSIRLRRGAVPANALDGSEDIVRPSPRGRVLQPDTELLVHDEEVPREGARVTRAYKYARGADGSTYLWIGRRKQSGRGEGSSGLRFDFLEETRIQLSPEDIPGAMFLLLSAEPSEDISGALFSLLDD
jgi:hypothetical protein